VEPSKPIRLGFISPDLRKHAIGFLVRDLFSLLDPARFEVHIYDLNPKPGDEISEQIRTTSPHYMDLSASTNREAVARIRQDGIDMLVDLAGYTALARPEILAARPAPLQINHMGFPGSMQAGFIDYVIGCPLLIPVGHEEHYSESVIRLPQVHNMVSGWPSPAVTPSRADCGLPEDTLVFACFNGNRKIDPELFNVWMNILRRLPKSVLWLLGDNGDAETNLRAGATARGIDPGRIIFAGRISTDGHIARLRQADLYLDTCLYSAFTNLSMALWAGLPVLSLLGRDYATRMGAAAVQAAGLPELIVDDLEAYENLAVDLGRDGARLKSFKQRLAGLGHSSPLFDKAQYVRDLEAGLKQAWSRYLEGKEPADIDVESKPVSDG
jgi:protein O-GlcNAc transferase